MSLEFAAAVAERGLDVTFEVADGETVALLGQNGAGKSSVLGVVAGQLRPDSARVVLDGRALTVTDERVDLPPYRRGIALLAQEPLLFPHLTVRENVAFAPRSHGRPRRDAHRDAERLLAEVGVPDLADRRATELSGGQAQRVAVARALAAEPRLLLLDEPMAALDVGVRPALRQLLRRVLASRTAVIVTHDVLDALLLADRVIVLEAGRIVEDGPTKAVLSRPRSTFAAQLAGLNLLTGIWTGDRVRLDDGSEVHGLAHGSLAVGEPAVATFRPGAVAVYRQASSGSPRNTFAVRISELEPSGELVRVRGDGLSADVTPYAAADLDLAPGQPVTFTVKATEVAVYGL